jgi:toxin-antitoxin system PIN domain toxin
MPHHAKAREWLEESLQDSYSPVALSIVSVLAFIRISTNPKVFDPPHSVEYIKNNFLPFLAHPNIRILQSNDDHVLELLDLMSESGVVGNDTMDAHIAALALSTGAKLATNDKGFSRFKGLRLINPLKTTK